MKCLKINKQTISYALYLGKTEVIEGGKRTGRFTISYGVPVTVKMNVSPAAGNADVETYGVKGNYTHILVTDDMSIPFDENTVFWIGEVPTNPYNFVTVRVARTLNSVSIMVREVAR